MRGPGGVAATIWRCIREVSAEPPAMRSAPVAVELELVLQALLLSVRGTLSLLRGARVERPSGTNCE